MNFASHLAGLVWSLQVAIQGAEPSSPVPLVTLAPGVSGDFNHTLCAAYYA